jgi:hypothetical protein
VIDGSGITVPDPSGGGNDRKKTINVDTTKFEFRPYFSEYVTAAALQKKRLLVTQVGDGSSFSRAEWIIQVGWQTR